MIRDEISALAAGGVISEESHIPASEETDRIGNEWFGKDEEAEKFETVDGDLYGFIECFRNLDISDEDVIWFTDDYDEFGAYRDTVRSLQTKMDRIFRCGVSAVHFVSPIRDAGFSIESYIASGRFTVKVCGHGHPYEATAKKIQQVAAGNVR